MPGLRCVDCIFSDFKVSDASGRYQGTCSRGYTLADPHVHAKPDMFFAEKPNQLVPVIDPFGAEYLRTSNVCERFTRPGGDTVSGR